MRLNLLHWNGLRFDTVKRGINFKMSNTLFRVSFAVLCSRIGTQLTSKQPPGRPQPFHMPLPGINLESQSEAIFHSLCVQKQY